VALTAEAVAPAARAAAVRTDTCIAAAEDSAEAERIDTAERAVAAVVESQVAAEEPPAVRSAAAADSPAQVGQAVDWVAVGSLERSAAAPVQFALERRSERRQSRLRPSTVRLTSEHPSSLTIPPVREGFKQARELPAMPVPAEDETTCNTWRNTRVPLLRRAHTMHTSICQQRTGRVEVDRIRAVPLRKCSARGHA
jgi:hypothetical protein